MSKRPALLALASLLIVLGMLLIPSAYGRGSDFLRVSYINVGQGDSIWLHASDQTDILIDGGDTYAGPTVVAYGFFDDDVGLAYKGHRRNESRLHLVFSSSLLSHSKSVLQN